MKVRWEDMEAYVASEFAKGKESVAYSLNHPVIFSREKTRLRSLLKWRTTRNWTSRSAKL